MAAPLISAAGRATVGLAGNVLSSLVRGGARALGGAASGLFRQASQRRNVAFSAKVRWFGDRLERDVEISQRKRINLAAQLTRDRVVLNISRPVTKYKTRSGRTAVDPTSRSSPGEFPKLDTGRLRRDIYWEATGNDANPSAVVATSLHYGLLLEAQMDRSFLRRTLREMQPVLRRILTRPM